MNAYGIAFAAGIITAAALGDRFGRRRVFLAGLALFTLASAACAVAPGAVLLAGFFAWEARAAAPMLPLLRIRAFAAGNATGLLLQAARFAWVAALTSGFRPALAVSAGLSLLGALTALPIVARRRSPAAEPDQAEVTVAA